RLGANDDVIDARLQVSLDGGEVADAAADLDRQVRKAPCNRLDDLAIDRLAGKGAVQVNQMQQTRAFPHPACSQLDRIDRKRCGIIHAFLTQTYALVVLQINGWNHEHVGGISIRRIEAVQALLPFQVEKFLSNCSPACLLFSGWNWTAKTFSFCTAAANGRPYWQTPATAPASRSST